MNDEKIVDLLWHGSEQGVDALNRKYGRLMQSINTPKATMDRFELTKLDCKKKKNALSGVIASQNLRHWAQRISNESPAQRLSFAGKREMTLDHCIFHLQQPRVISVLSYYLTSVINLSFFRLDIVFRSTGSHSEAFFFVLKTYALSELSFMSINFSGIGSLCPVRPFGLSLLVLPVHRVSPFLMLI